MTAPNQWDFTDLDAVTIPILSVGDHSPELQLATAPSWMDDSNGHLLRSHFQDFAKYCANMVRYYNKGGFDAGGKHYQSPSPYGIHWWGIFNEPNINGISASDYVTLYNLVVPAMQAVDPTIRVVAVELADFGRIAQQSADVCATCHGAGGTHTPRTITPRATRPTPIKPSWTPSGTSSCPTCITSTPRSRQIPSWPNSPCG